MRSAVLRWCLLALALLALVVVPFLLYGDRFFEALAGSLGSGSNWQLASLSILLLLGLDVFAPVPSSLVATASGTVLGLVPGAAVTWLGMQAGAFVGYGFGRTAGVGAARRIVGLAELERATRLHRRWGGLSLIACRAVPILAESSVLLAGGARMPVGRFAWLTGLSNGAIATVYAAVGVYALETRSFLLAFGASMLVPGLLMGASRILGTRNRPWRQRQGGMRLGITDAGDQ